MLREAALLALLLLALCRPAAAQQRPDAYIVKIEGIISQAYSKAVQRKIDKAWEEGVDTIILELDTPGGTVGDSMELADYIFQLEQTEVIAYVHPEAYSGGTMVALACKEIYIAESVGMMGDVAPVGPTGDIAGEKFQTVIREKMASYARARGYPEALVKAMVTKELEVWRLQMADEPEGTLTYVTGAELTAMTDEQAAKIISRKLVVAAGQLLTMDANQAVQYGFARATVGSEEELLDVLGLRPGSVDRLYLTGSERLLTFLDAFSPFLIVAGCVLLFIEVSHPGFGLPGILGIGCFVIFFVIKVTLHYARMLEILLFVVGILLLLVEVFITPGFGVTGISGLVLVFISLVLASQEFGLPGTPRETLAFQYNLLKVTGALALSGVAFVVMARYLTSLPLLSRIVHRGDLAAAHAGELGEVRTPGLAEMIGEVGVALTALRPAGRAEFGDRLLDVVTEGDFVEKGARIQIQQIHGSRVVVKPHREG
ncbi:MAG: NfeD family protein [Planctomycetota bacterium]|jgi:membrane-bound serine protease (ClpP class)